MTKTCARVSGTLFWLLGLLSVCSCAGHTTAPVALEHDSRVAPARRPTSNATVEPALDGIRLSDANAPVHPVASSSITALDDQTANGVFDALPALVSLPVPKHTQPSRNEPPPNTPTLLEPFAPMRGLGSPAARERGTLVTITHQSPVGEIWSAPFLSATFSEPMVPMASFGALARIAPPLVLTPEPPGTWRWLGTRTAVFQPRERFAMATAFSVTQRPGAASVAGNPVSVPSPWTFGTPAPSVLDNYPPPGSNHLVLEPKFFIHFDQRIDPAKMLPFVELKTNGKAHAMRLRDNAEKTRDEQVTPEEERISNEAEGTYAPRLTSNVAREWLALRVVEPLPQDADLQLTIKRGAPSAEGPRTTDHDQVFRYRTHGPFRLEHAPCEPGRPCEPGGEFQLNFSNDVDTESFKKTWVTISPAVEDFLVAPAHGGDAMGLRLYGRFRADTEYTLLLSDQVRDRFGQKLGKVIRYRFTVGSATPRLQLDSSSMVVLDPSLPPELLFQTVNQPEVIARVYRVQPLDWPKYLEYSRGSSVAKANDAALPGQLIATESLYPKGPADDLLCTRLPLGKYLDDGKGHLIVQLQGIRSSRWRSNNESGAVADYGHATTAVTWVQATAIGIKPLVDQDRVHVWTMNLATGAPLSGVNLGLLGNPESALTNADGIGLLRLSKNRSPAVVAKRGKDVALMPEFNTSLTDLASKPELSWYVVDSGGLYQPGDTVHVKGWLRQRDHGAHADLVIPESVKNAQLDYSFGTSFMFSDGETATGPRGTTRVNSAGEFDLSFVLPRTTSPGRGDVHLRIVKPGDDYRLKHNHSIRIAEFERPEYEVSLQADAGPHYVGNSAVATVSGQYFTGGPLSAAKVAWNVDANWTSYTPPNWKDYRFGADNHYGLNAQSAPPAKHTGNTDRNGHHRLRIDFARTTDAYPRRLTISASVTDLNQRSFSASSEILVHPAALTVGLKPVQYVIAPGDPMRVDVIVTDIDGKVAEGHPVHVQSTILRPNGEKYRDDEVESCQFESTATPHRCELPVGDSGSYVVKATVMDAQGRQSQTSTVVRAVTQRALPRDARREREVHMAFDKASYQSGEKAELLIASPFAPAEGLLAIHRQGAIAELRRFRMQANTTRLVIDVEPEYLPRVYADVYLVGSTMRRRLDGMLDPQLPPLPTFAQGMTPLSVSSDHRKLGVEISPIKGNATPGSSTPFEVTVTDPLGKPAAGAQVALMVIDEALLSLLDAHNWGPLDTFYRDLGANPARSALHGFMSQWEQQKAREAAAKATKANLLPADDSTRATRMSSMLSAARYSVEDESRTPTTVRTDFRAVAGFAPNLVTDAKGHAHTAFKLPDSVTRYRVTATAAQGARNFGQGERTFAARLPLLVRPAAPQFLNRGDTFELQVLLQNPSNRELPVQLAARGRNANIVGPQGFMFSIPAGDRVQARFNVSAATVGDATIQIAAKSSLGADAVQTNIPVLAPTVVETFAHSGVLLNGSVAQRIDVPEGVIPQFGGLELHVSSSAVDALTQALHSLLDSEYETNEMRASRILALCALRQLPAHLHSSDLSPSARDKIMRRELARLIDSSRSGTWDYWGHGERGSPWMLTYASHALLAAKAQGFAIDASVLKEAQKGLARLNPTAKDARARSTMLAHSAYLQSLYDAKKAAAKASLLISEVGSIDKLPLEAVAWLLAAINGNASFAAEIAELKRTVGNSIAETADTAHALSSRGESSPYADAVVLHVLMLVDPEHPLAAKLAKGLLTSRKANGWRGNASTALAILALATYLERHEQTPTESTVRTWLGSQLVATRTVSSGGPRAAYTSMPFDLLRDGGRSQVELVMSKHGQGPLYYRFGLTYALEDQRSVATEQGFSVLRIFQAIDDPSDVMQKANGLWDIRLGARVRVHTFLQTVSQRNYVALTDSLPAGLQFVDTSFAATPPLPVRSSSEQTFEAESLGATDRAQLARVQAMSQAAQHHWYEHHVVRKDRVQAFASELPPGTYAFEYVARAVTPGTFLAPAPKVEEIQNPETFGRGDAAVVVVR